MTLLAHLRVLAPAFGLVLAACASVPADPYAFIASSTPEQAVAMASEAASGGQLERAAQILDAAKKANPTSKEPWLKSARLHFDAADYVGAIADAQQVLERDANDRTAQGLIVVSGLRLSTQAIAEMVRVEGLDGNTRGEAEKLARSLRESLGEIVLVPTPAMPVAPAAAPSRPAPRPRAPRATAAAPEAPKPKPTDTPSCPPGNPFCGL